MRIEASTNIMTEQNQDKRLPPQFATRQELGRHARMKLTEKQRQQKEDAEKYRKLMEEKK